MGQSQSQIEKNKQRPINPQKIFGMIFFQRSYDEVIQTKKDMIEMKFAAEMERVKNESQDGADQKFEAYWKDEYENFKKEKDPKNF